MKQMILGRFLQQGNRDFPVDCEMFDYMQTNLEVVSILGNIVGDKAILSGCELVGTTHRNAGYVFLKTKDFKQGEVIYWEGGSISNGMYIKTEAIEVTAQNYHYPQAYIKRSLAPGFGPESYSWSDFFASKTPQELDRYNKEQDAAIDSFSREPIGVIQLWAGTKQAIPENYALCNGDEYKIKDYQELYNAIEDQYNSCLDWQGNKLSTSSGYFRIPDLQGRFIVGYNPKETDYNIMGNVDGEKTVKLKEHHLASHTHLMNMKWGGYRHNDRGDAYKTIGEIAPEVLETFTIGRTNATGDGDPHENRPPYYTLAYIIRLK